MIRGTPFTNITTEITTTAFNRDTSATGVSSLLAKFAEEKLTHATICDTLSCMHSIVVTQLAYKFEVFNVANTNASINSQLHII